MRSSSRVAWIAVAAALGAAVAVACSSNAVGVQACREIETARCEAAPACAGFFDLQLPVPSGDPVVACIRYYNDECQHGLATTVTPSNVAVTQCVAAINAAGRAARTDRDSGADCTIVAAPQTIAACTFLNPVDAGTTAATSDDAAATTDSADAASE